MSSVFVCWHSRKWWPPIRGGQLQLALLQLEKAKWTDFFCKKGISYTYFWWKCKKQDEKLTKILKKSFFFQPLWPSGWVHLIWSGPYQVDLIWSGPNQVDLIWSGPNQVELSQMAGGARKNSFFWQFLAVFCPVFCFFTKNIYNKKIFWKKIGPSLLFLEAGATDTKVRRSTGVTTANSTNIRNTVELGDQLVVMMMMSKSCCSEVLISISTFARQKGGGFWKAQRGYHTTDVTHSVPMFQCFQCNLAA